MPALLRGVDLIVVAQLKEDQVSFDDFRLVNYDLTFILYVNIIFFLVQT